MNDSMTTTNLSDFLSRIGLPQAALDLRPAVNPIVTGRQPPSVTYLLFGRLPEGATFDAATGRIGGRALEPGSHQVWVSATDSTGGTVTAGITIVVT